MDRPYDNIPRQGEHLGRDHDEEPTTNVRAQEAVKPTSAESADGGVIQHLYNETEGRHRIRRWPNASEITAVPGYEETQRIPEGKSLTDIFEALSGQDQYVVLENVESGKVHFDRNTELSENWTGNGEYDQVTIFHDEEAAAAYASSRRKTSS